MYWVLFFVTANFVIKIKVVKLIVLMILISFTD